MDLIWELPNILLWHDGGFCGQIKQEDSHHANNKKCNSYTTSSIASRCNFCESHGLSKVLIIDRVNHFTILFWKTLLSYFKTKLTLSMAYHPRTNEQTKRSNKIIEYMLWAFTLEEQEEWNTLLTLVEFA